MQVDDAVKQLDALRKEWGVSIFDQAVKKINRRRLEVDVSEREKRVKFSWSLYKKKYARQRGVCPLCGNDMPIVQGSIEMDHINPNESDFNADFNLQVVHATCNRKKSGSSVMETSKSSGRTFLEQISIGMED